MLSAAEFRKRTAGPPGRNRAGFTMIEVLVALIILAIGLLGLEALGIVAVRSVGIANRNSRSAAVATRYLEDALQQIQQDTARPQSCTGKLLPNGDVVTRTVFIANTASEPSRVVVTVTPEARGTTQRPYTVSGYVYFPDILSRNKAGRACP